MSLSSFSPDSPKGIASFTAKAFPFFSKYEKKKLFQYIQV